MKIGNKTIFDKNFGIYLQDEEVYIPRKLGLVLKDAGVRPRNLIELLIYLESSPSYFAKKLRMEKEEYYTSLNSSKKDFDYPDEDIDTTKYYYGARDPEGEY